ncbi:hypothetical protein RQ479_29620 [Mesorhizobium sp. ISC25]|uniref:hypothetical protein n=1 Tax=Mesorhizobium sp. ISC25 TaxID=3077335 RepID=UPI0035DED483
MASSKQHELRECPGDFAALRAAFARGRYSTTTSAITSGTVLVAGDSNPDDLSVAEFFVPAPVGGPVTAHQPNVDLIRARLASPPTRVPRLVQQRLIGPAVLDVRRVFVYSLEQPGRRDGSSQRSKSLLIRMLPDRVAPIGPRPSPGRRGLFACWFGLFHIDLASETLGEWVSP